MKKWAQKQSGFTIVELLIVVVVIAILAAITIVAYNGIQNRAKNSAVQSATSQIAKKISLWQVDNADQAPPDLATAGVTSTAGSDYEYTPNGTNWCVTVTSSSVSYYASDVSKNPKVGGCAGHAQNGTAAITNFIPNTSLETDTALVSSIGSPSARLVERINGVSAFRGDYVLRVTWTAGGAMGGYGAFTADSLPVGDYVGSMWVRSNAAMQLRPYLEGTASKTAIVTPTNITTVPGVWTRITYTLTVTAPGTIKMCWLGQSTAAAGNYVDMDAIMLTSSTTLYNFADGNSSNWSWNGTQNASTSKGIPI